MSAAENKAVFLSYASQDAAAARRICEALRAAGVEVWFDQSELVGGDQWDAKIRGQISSCALFVPVISAATQARLEGYFRIEWKLAARRTHAMAAAKAFLFPIVIDATRDAEAHVPDEFREVQWTKLPGGETPPAFGERVKKLLDGTVAGVADPGRPGSPSPATTKMSGPSQWWWVLPVFGLSMALLLVLREGRKEPSPTVPAVPPPAAPVPASEVHQLTEQAQALINKPGAARAELEAAEELCKKAAKLDPTDAEVLSAWSQVCSWLVFHGFDASPERREEARFKAAQALQLAPGSYEARLAQACYLVRGGGIGAIVPEGDQADGLLQSLLREKPDEPRTLLALGFQQGRSGHLAEARATLGRLAENPGFAATAWGELGWLEMFAANHAAAEAAVDRANALQPLWRNLILKMLLAVEWRGDLDLARATLKRLPQGVQQEDVGVFTATYLCYLRHEPEQMLHTLEADPRDWFHTGGYVGPKAVWAALAHEQLGAKDRAAAQWQLALKSIERSLDERPDRNTQLLEAYALAALGRDADAEKTLGLVRDASVPEPLPWLRRNRYVVTQLRLGHPEAALDYLEHDPRLTAAVLEHEPQLDRLRGLPRFQALQERIEADPSRSPKAKAAAPAGTAAIVPPVADDKSVAVLAFANLSDDKANEYFSDGISEELLNVLAKVPGLKVAARTSAFYFKDKNVPIPEIAQKLGVAYVVEGSVRKAGTQVRITAQLINAADGFHVWSDTFTRELKDIFAVQDEIAGLIAKNLQLKMGAAARVARTVDPEAHRLVLEGRYFWNLRTDEGFARAETAFVRAIEIDPKYAEAHSGLAGVCVIRDQYRVLDGYDANPADAGRARTEAQRAIELEPTLAEPHAVLGYGLMFENRLAESEQEFQRALTLNPNDPVVRCWHANNLAALGRIDQSLPEYEKAAELDPLWFINYQVYLRGLVSAQRYEDALKTATRAAALRAETDIFIPSLGYVAEASLALGRKDEAVETARRVRRNGELRPRWDADAQAIFVLREAGFGREAEDYAKEVFARLPSGSYMRGWILVALGRLDEALPFLEQRQSGLLLGIYWGTMWDPWREDPRFGQILAKNDRTEEYKVARTTLTRMLQERATNK